jgi:hypothetical protein
VIPHSLTVIVNYRGMAGRLRWRGGPLNPPAARIFGAIFFVGGLIAISLAIHRFVRVGY